MVQKIKQTAKDHPVLTTVGVLGTIVAGVIVFRGTRKIVRDIRALDLGVDQRFRENQE